MTKGVVSRGLRCNEVVLALVCDTVWLTNSRSQGELTERLLSVVPYPRHDVLPCTDRVGLEREFICVYIQKQRQSLLSSWAAAASLTNGRAKAETGSTRYVFVFTDGTADKLVMEKEVVYVSSLKEGGWQGGWPITIPFWVIDGVSH